MCQVFFFLSNWTFFFHEPIFDFVYSLLILRKRIFREKKKAKEIVLTSNGKRLIGYYGKEKR